MSQLTAVAAATTAVVAATYAASPAGTAPAGTASAATVSAATASTVATPPSSNIPCRLSPSAPPPPYDLSLHWCRCVLRFCVPAAQTPSPGPPTWKHCLANLLVKLMLRGVLIAYVGLAYEVRACRQLVSLVKAAPAAIMAVKDLVALSASPAASVSAAAAATPRVHAAAAAAYSVCRASLSSRLLRQVAPGRCIGDRVAPGMAPSKVQVAVRRRRTSLARVRERARLYQQLADSHTEELEEEIYVWEVESSVEEVGEKEKEEI